MKDNTIAVIPSTKLVIAKPLVDFASCAGSGAGLQPVAQAEALLELLLEYHSSFSLFSREIAVSSLIEYAQCNKENRFHIA